MIFDEVFVCQGVNPDKPRTDGVLLKLKGIKTKTYSCLTADLIVSFFTLYNSVTLIRGIRNGYDYEYEMNQIQVMRDLLPMIQTILIPCDREFNHISSTMIRNLSKFDPTTAACYQPLELIEK